jgi:hypothetical protein
MALGCGGCGDFDRRGDDRRRGRCRVLWRRVERHRLLALRNGAGDPDAFFAFLDFELGNTRCLDQIDQRLEFAQVHTKPSGVSADEGAKFDAEDVRLSSRSWNMGEIARSPRRPTPTTVAGADTCGLQASSEASS